jgi:hypothetical protein
MLAEVDIGVLRPLTRNAADLDLRLTVLAGPDPVEAAAGAWVARAASSRGR